VFLCQEWDQEDPVGVQVDLAVDQAVQVQDQAVSEAHMAALTDQALADHTDRDSAQDQVLVLTDQALSVMDR